MKLSYDIKTMSYNEYCNVMFDYHQYVKKLKDLSDLKGTLSSTRIFKHQFHIEQKLERYHKFIMSIPEYKLNEFSEIEQSELIMKSIPFPFYA